MKALVYRRDHRGRRTARMKGRTGSEANDEDANGRGRAADERGVGV